MQKTNVNLPIVITGRHGSTTPELREYAQKKVEGLHLDYPRIIEAKVVLDTDHKRQIAEIILFCANHITIEADSESMDMHAAIDETISKIARRMRKYKTRLLKKHRPRGGDIRHIEQQVVSPEIPELEAEPAEEEAMEPVIIHSENYKIRPLFTDEAIMEMELSERDFIVFENAKKEKLSILFRRKDGDYGIIEP